jgi:2-methylcitrate dehydratase PrpD
MEKVRIVADDAMDSEDPNEYGNIVVLRTRGGGVHTGERRVFKGNPRDPLTKEEFEEKFTRLAGHCIGGSQIKTAIDTIERLDEWSDAGPLTAVLSP